MMVEQFWVHMVRGFGALALFSASWAVAWLLWKVIPAGRAKSVLFDKSLEQRHPWKFGLGLAFGGLGVMLLIAWFTFHA